MPVAPSLAFPGRRSGERASPQGVGRNRVLPSNQVRLRGLYESFGAYESIGGLYYESIQGLYPMPPKPRDHTRPLVFGQGWQDAQISMQTVLSGNRTREGMGATQRGCPQTKR